MGIRHIRGLMNKLLEVDPWASLLTKERTFFVTWYTFVRVCLIFSAGAIFCLLFQGFMNLPAASGFGWLVLSVPVLFGAFLYCWTRPTFAWILVGAQELQTGMVFCGDKNRNEAGTATWASKANLVLDSFQHYGRYASRVRVALADGTSREFTPHDSTRIAIKHDVFRRFRSPFLKTYDLLPEVTTEAVAVMAALWNVHFHYTSADKGAIAEADGLDFDVVERGLSQGQELNLVLRDVRGFGKGKEEFFVLSQAGAVVLAAICRSKGVEIYSDAEEKRMIQNHGNIIWNSPGAAAVQGSGHAHGNVVNSNDRGIPDFDELFAALNSIIDRLKASKADDINYEISAIERESALAEPELSSIKRSVRNVLRTSGSVLKGALGSGAWAVWAAWAGFAE